MSVTFAKDAVSITIRNPEVGNIDAIRRRVPVGETEGGDIFAYKQGTASQDLELSWTELTNTEKADLQGFIEDTVDGSYETFTYTDHDGTDWTARILDDETRFEEFFDNRWAVRLRLRAVEV